MDNLYAPWRSVYFSDKKDYCVFCNIVEKVDDDESLAVLFRTKNCFGVMNRFPYTPGHFMIIPNLHIDNLESLDEKIWHEMSYYVQKGVKIVKQSLNAPAVNIGMNLGICAGAGIAEHIHYHIVPRWHRDTNFITTIGETRVNGVPFENMYKKLKKAFDECMK